MGPATNSASSPGQPSAPSRADADPAFAEHEIRSAHRAWTQYARLHVAAATPLRSLRSRVASDPAVSTFRAMTGRRGGGAEADRRPHDDRERDQPPVATHGEPAPAEGAVEQHPQAEQQEQHGGHAVQEPLGQTPVQHMHRRRSRRRRRAPCPRSRRSRRRPSRGRWPARRWRASSCRRARRARTTRSPRTARTGGSATGARRRLVVAAVPPGPHRETGGTRWPRRRRWDAPAGSARGSARSSPRGRAPGSDGDADPGQHHPPAVAQRVRHRHQLRLVAEFGEEDDAETDQSAASIETTFRRVADGPKSLTARQTFGRRSRPPLACGSPAGLAPVCRHDDWGLLPFADDITIAADSAARQLAERVRVPVFERSRTESECQLRKPLCGKEHRQYRGVGMADRIDADAADHRRDGAVGFRFHPRGTVFQAEMREARAAVHSPTRHPSTPAVTAWSPTVGAASTSAGG